MPPFLPDPEDLRAWCALAVPILLSISAWRAGAGGRSVPAAWRLARLGIGLALAAGFAALAAPWFGAAAGVDRHGLQAAVLLLILFLGWVITRFAATYLEGEPGQPRFVRALLATLAGSSLVVSTDHLGVLALAWLGTSLAMQGLLTFYRERPNAQMAAHKKFITARLADICMFGAVLLFAGGAGTLRIDELTALAATGEPLGSSVQAAVLLVATAVLLKSAQLPFHGWLMQVMEAPTPVSALLHAGVVNLGGFVLIRLGPLVAETPAAQLLLVLIGGLTAVLAALVTTTRISVKLALAWSTCAQMGFMVMQCGLGLFDMALLHLGAHSLYKAQAFLGAGGAVQKAVVGSMAAAPVPAGLAARALGLTTAVASVYLAAPIGGVSVGAEPALFAMAVVLALALSPLSAPRGGHRPLAANLSGAAVAFAVALAWFGLHRLMHGWLGGLAPAAAPWLAGLALALFALLYLVQNLVALQPASPLSRRLHTWCYGGFFVDEAFTRLTLRVWPIRSPSPVPSPAPEPLR
jgi:NAD(P)H-quinone oxidoreductase subunit 5